MKKEKFYLAIKMHNEIETYEVIGFSNSLTHRHWRQRLSSKHRINLLPDVDGISLYESDSTHEFFNLYIDRVSEEAYKVLLDNYLGNEIRLEPKKYIYRKCVIIDDDKALYLGECCLNMYSKNVMCVKFKENSKYYTFEYINDDKTKLMLNK